MRCLIKYQYLQFITYLIPKTNNKSMKTTKQKSRLSILGVLGFTLMGSFVCVTASAQTSAEGPQQGHFQSKQPITKEHASGLKQAHPVPSHHKVPITAVGEAGTTQQEAIIEPSTATNKMNAAPVRIEQLQYQRKQAAEKGQSTKVYDQAIQQHLINQAK